MNKEEGNSMKQEIYYRPFQKQDTRDLASVISESWNYEKMFSKKAAYHFSHIFLYYELARQAFTQVADVDGKAAGIIVGNIKDESKTKYKWLYWPKIIGHGVCLLARKEGRDILMNYVGEVGNLNKKMMDNLDESFDTELSLFAVTPKVQGLGVGSELFRFFTDKLKQKRMKKFFLYTDTTCNYGFYDYKGLSRISAASKKIGSPVNEEIEFYIYKGNVT